MWTDSIFVYLPNPYLSPPYWQYHPIHNITYRGGKHGKGEGGGAGMSRCQKWKQVIKGQMWASIGLMLSQHWADAGSNTGNNFSYHIMGQFIANVMNCSCGQIDFIICKKFYRRFDSATLTQVKYRYIYLVIVQFIYMLLILFLQIFYKLAQY